MARAKRVKGKQTQTHSENLREKLLAEMLPQVAFDGWSDKTLNDAANKLGIDDADLKAAFPRGMIDALLFFSHQADDQAEELVAAADLKPMKIRERISFAVKTRIEVIRQHRVQSAVAPPCSRCRSTHWMVQRRSIEVAT